MAKLKKIPFKIWFFGFAVLLLTASFVRLPHVVADDTAYERYSRDNYVGLRMAVVKYHKNMNDIVNEYIKKLLANEGTVEPPEEDVPLGELCPDDNNVSTYCLSLRLVQEYEGFVHALKDQSNFALDPAEVDEGGTITTMELSERQTERSELINTQIVLSGQVMDVMLGVYNELQVFYPLHVKYEELIVELEDYRDGLADVRRQVEKYPGKFLNVSTTECT